MCKKIIGLFLTLTLVSCISIFVYADDKNGIDYAPMSDEAVLIIEVNSPEELEQLWANIEANNARVENLWNLALEESKKEENQLNVNDIMLPQRRALALSSTRYGHKMLYYNYLLAVIEFSATYETGTDSYGNTIFNGTIYSQNVYPSTSNSSVSVNYKDSNVFLDGRRTLATKYSLVIGAKEEGGTMRYESALVYVELYISGGGYVVS